MSAYNEDLAYDEVYDAAYQSETSDSSTVGGYNYPYATINDNPDQNIRLSSDSRQSLQSTRSEEAQPTGDPFVRLEPIFFLQFHSLLHDIDSLILAH